MKRCIALAVWFATTGSVLAQGRNGSGGELIAEQAAYDVKHYDLSLSVDPEAKRIDGTLAMRAEILHPTTTMALDLDQRLNVERITSGDRELEFTHADGRIQIAVPGPVAVPGQEVVIAVAYGGVPREAPNPPWDGGFTWTTTKSGEPWIATSCQGEGADLWWPCKDHPSDEPDSMDLRITVPRGLFVATNGKLMSEEKGGSFDFTFWYLPEM
ncbi:MAG: M1 family metallopeptidase [bacterium]|nr:M1 family metallopeptidase [bacterium]